MTHILLLASPVQWWVMRKACWVGCLKALGSGSLMSCKLRFHLEKTHPEHKDQPVDFTIQDYFFIG